MLEYGKHHHINHAWLSAEINARGRDSTYKWIKKGIKPRDDQVWVRMAQALGLFSPAKTRIVQLAKDLAYDVLDKYQDPETTRKAVAIIKEADAVGSYGR